MPKTEHVTNFGVSNEWRFIPREIISCINQKHKLETTKLSKSTWHQCKICRIEWTVENK